MRTITQIERMQKTSDELRREGRVIGLVPTMGSLHEGHLSLVDIANKHADITVASVFVNPNQFGPGEDYKKYPRNLQRDKRLLKERGCSIVFAPNALNIYDRNFKSEVYVRDLSGLLCGATRKIHFKGVTTIVAKLFNIVKPHIAVFGQKDAQQVIIIRRMVYDLDFDTKILVGPIVRETDGLAMSSRNVYLSNIERKEAKVIYQSLQLAEKMIEKGEKEAEKILRKMRSLIGEKKHARIDYVEIVDTIKLKSVKRIKGEVLIAVACYFGKTRLIDNAIVKGKK